VRRAASDISPSRKRYRTSLGYFVADRDHEIETVAKKVIHGLRKQRGRINRELVLENRLRDWMNLACGVAPGAEDNGASFRQAAQERFSDL
jgi:hypothetical protein